MLNSALEAPKDSHTNDANPQIAPHQAEATEKYEATSTSGDHGEASIAPKRGAHQKSTVERFFRAPPRSDSHNDVGLIDSATKGELGADVYEPPPGALLRCDRGEELRHAPEHISFASGLATIDEIKRADGGVR